MNCFKLVFLTAVVMIALFAFAGCTSDQGTQDQGAVNRQIQKIAASLPKRIDPATTLIAVRSDGHGGVIFVDSVDTHLVNFPSRSVLMRMLCDVHPDSPPPGNHSPFTSITYIYNDLRGNQLAQLHLQRGECPGQGM